jgi:NAD(P)-dependent dehydrogenase (short-subunit alcohol dehydrogenase family)
MRKHHFGRILNISSGMGQLEDMNGGWPGYRLSKVALKPNSLPMKLRARSFGW